MNPWPIIERWIGSDGRAGMVRVVATEGSCPREAGAAMVVRADGQCSGSIGGGALELEALGAVAGMLAGPPAGRLSRIVLGPGLGQCCGGVVTLRLEAFGRDDLDWIEPLARCREPCFDTLGIEDGKGRLRRSLAGPERMAAGQRERFGAPRTPVTICGAGHVGRALVLALAPLPFAVRWIDSRDGQFPDHLPASVTPVLARDPVAALASTAPGTLLVVMTHDHALDLALVARALADPAFASVGLIGSATKRARFVSRLTAAGLPAAAIDRLVCPIGGTGVRDKHPAVIAAMVAAELLIIAARRADPAVSTISATAAPAPPVPD